MKKILMIMLLCTVLSLSACAAGGRDRNASGNLPQPRETLQITPEDEESTHISEQVLPEEITDGASAVYCSWPDDTCGFLLRCGYPAAGQMTKGLYRTTDGQNWTSVRELTAVIPNYPKGIFLWSQSQGIILTNYHVKAWIDGREAQIQKAEAAEAKYSAELEKALTEYHDLEARAESLDPEKLEAARLFLRPEEEKRAVSIVEDVYGKNYDSTVMCEAKNQLSNLLGEKSSDVTSCSLRENLKQKQQEGHHREAPHRKTSQDLEL